MQIKRCNFHLENASKHLRILSDRTAAKYGFDNSVCSVFLQGCLLIFIRSLNHNSFGSAILLRGFILWLCLLKYVGIFYKDVHRSIVYYNRMT